MPRKYPESFPVEVRQLVSYLAGATTLVQERTFKTRDYKEARAMQSLIDAYIETVRRTATAASAEVQLMNAGAREECRTFRQFYAMSATDGGLVIRPKSERPLARLVGQALEAFRELEGVDRLAGAPTAAKEPPTAPTGAEDRSIYDSLLGSPEPPSTGKEPPK